MEIITQALNTTAITADMLSGAIKKLVDGNKGRLNLSLDLNRKEYCDLEKIPDEDGNSMVNVSYILNGTELGKYTVREENCKSSDEVAEELVWFLKLVERNYPKKEAV